MLYLPYHLQYKSPSGENHPAIALEKASTFPEMALETYLQRTMDNNFTSPVNEGGCTTFGGSAVSSTNRIIQYIDFGGHSRQSYVYVIQNLYTGNIKIGTSVDPYARANNFQIGCDCELKLLCLFPGGLEMEQQLHALFSDYHVHGEWFRFSEEVQETLRPALEEYKAKPRPKIDGLSRFATELLDYLRPFGSESIAKTSLFANSQEIFGFGRARLKSCLRELELRGLICTKKTNRQSFVYLTEAGQL